MIFLYLQFQWILRFRLLYINTHIPLSCKTTHEYSICISDHFQRYVAVSSVRYLVDWYLQLRLNTYMIHYSKVMACQITGNSNSLFRLTPQKPSRLRITSPLWGSIDDRQIPFIKGTILQKTFPFNGVIRNLHWALLNVKSCLIKLGGHPLKRTSQ